MSERDDGGPAFPGVTDRYGNGMTLRDWFAGQALVGLLAGRGLVVRDGIPVVPTRDSLAVAAWEMSDAMLAARASHDSAAGGAK